MHVPAVAGVDEADSVRVGGSVCKVFALLGGAKLVASNLRDWQSS
jgi:hypothetical protein